MSTDDDQERAWCAGIGAAVYGDDAAGYSVVYGGPDTARFRDPVTTHGPTVKSAAEELRRWIDRRKAIQKGDRVTSGSYFFGAKTS